MGELSTGLPFSEGWAAGVSPRAERRTGEPLGSGAQQTVGSQSPSGSQLQPSAFLCPLGWWNRAQAAVLQMFQPLDALTAPELRAPLQWQIENVVSRSSNERDWWMFGQLFSMLMSERFYPPYSKCNKQKYCLKSIIEHILFYVLIFCLSFSHLP